MCVPLKAEFSPRENSKGRGVEIKLHTFNSSLNWHELSASCSRTLYSHGNRARNPLDKGESGSHLSIRMVSVFNSSFRGLFNETVNVSDPSRVVGLLMHSE
jgi:hypothetical protein